MFYYLFTWLDVDFDFPGAGVFRLLRILLNPVEQSELRMMSRHLVLSFSLCSVTKHGKDSSEPSVCLNRLFGQHERSVMLHTHSIFFEFLVLVTGAICGNSCQRTNKQTNK